jgi:hypothetical protein
VWQWMTKKILERANLTYSFTKDGKLKDPQNANVLVENVDVPKTNTLQINLLVQGKFQI